MSLDPNKMLESCRNGQWNVDDFDWTKTPEVELNKTIEMRFCQFYMDQCFIERLAGTLFQALSDRMDDPVLKEIYQWCHLDEIRHSQAAYKLCDYFDVNHYKLYTPNISLLKLTPHFVNLVKTTHPAVANAMILGGEIILDIALLRAINDNLPDPMSQAVVKKINRDEARHLAMDFFMTEYCAEHELPNDGYVSADLFDNADRRGFLRYGPAAFNEVFFRPMAILDPSGKQMESVMRRLRKLNLRESVKNNPAVKDFNNQAAFYETPLGGWVGWGIRKTYQAITGVNVDWIKAGSSDRLNLYDSDDETIDADRTAVQLAEDIVGETLTTN
ncbi:MAG: diiron oxygenase [bacterium]|nr:diiron oxygenase [bacterium]